MLTALHPFAISLFIGLLIGIDRERSHPEGIQAMGVRSFMMLGLLGTLAARIDQPALALFLSAIAASLILAGYLRSTAYSLNFKDIGITTELSAVVVYGIGFIVVKEPGLGTILGILVLSVLVSRHWLHSFARNILLPKEINAAVTLLFFLIVLVPFLPNRTVDPWSLFNPRRFGLLAAVIATMQFVGYVAARALGHRTGLVLMGFLGGLVSSTVAVATLTGQVKKNPLLAAAATAAVMLSVVAMLVELLVMLASAALPLDGPLGLAVVAMITTGVLFAWIAARNAPREEGEPPTANPLDIRSVAKLTGLIAGLLLVVAVARQLFGAPGMQLIAFIGGLFELHGVSLAAATMHFEGKVTLQEAELSIALALVASFITKFALLWGLGKASAFAFAWRVSAYLLSMLAVGASVYFLLPSLTSSTL